MTNLKKKRLINEYTHLHHMAEELLFLQKQYFEVYSNGDEWDDRFLEDEWVGDFPDDDYNILCIATEKVFSQKNELVKIYGLEIVSDEIISERISHCDIIIKQHEEFLSKEGKNKYSSLTSIIEEQKALKAKYEAELRERGG